MSSHAVETALHSFCYGPAVRSGAGASSHVGGLLPLGPLLFVTDLTMVKLGLSAPVIKALEAAGHSITVFDAVEPDPSLETLQSAVKAGRLCRAVGVVGFGGGSPMDVAKLAAYLLGSGDDLDNLWGVGKALGQKLPLVLIPTTAGTGSEATAVSIITLGGGEKRGVNSSALLADFALLDPVLTLGLPRAVTAATGIDAMVHAIEAYTSARLKNPFSDMFAREALRLLSVNLLRACDTPGDLVAREAMLLGAHYAGVAFANAPVAGVHALAYPLGGHFHVAHGLSNALMLPHVLRHNIKAACAQYAELAPILDPDLERLDSEGRAAGLIEALVSLCSSSGLPSRLRDVGVSAGDLDLLADEAMKQERLLINNPSPINRADARRLYEAAL